MFERMRRQEKKVFDSIHEMRDEKMKSEDLMLWHDPLTLNICMIEVLTES